MCVCNCVWACYCVRIPACVHVYARLSILAAVDERVVGGQNCGRHQQPYQVALMRSPKIVRCGGVLIHPCWVLTAAHCALNSPISMRLGEYSLRTTEGTEQFIKSTQSFVHPNYNSTTHDSDLMLLKLQNVARINNYVRTIDLPDNCPEPNTECVVSGWGTIKTPQGVIFGMDGWMDGWIV
uniref:Peptidase S1 domain-containing protein n=1 Tax=Pelusios castaneus TaxID=367368 RepID=A0A8C8RRD5_9SAUR